MIAYRMQGGMTDADDMLQEASSGGSRARRPEHAGSKHLAMQQMALNRLKTLTHDFLSK
jgi:hypothetical protein